MKGDYFWELRKIAFQPLLRKNKINKF